ncbi:MAG: hypothetical protein NVS2B9_05180 [Myxococcales bacterium]
MDVLQRLALCCALTLSLGGGAAFAHDTGRESRTISDCEKLPGNGRRGQRGACLRCVQRPKKRHFHPDYPAGRRCRPDNGKP